MDTNQPPNESAASRAGKRPLLAGPRGPAITAAFCDALMRGLPKRHAAAVAGISEGTYHDWRRRGEAGEEPYAAFMQRVYEAEAQLQDDLLQTVKHMALGLDKTARAGERLKAAQFLLERRWPQDWAQTKAVELTGADGGPVQTESAKPLFTDEQLANMTAEQLEAALLALGAEEGA